MWLSMWSLATIAATICVVSAQNQSAMITFTNTERFLFDVNGDQVDAYGSKINYFDGKYYMYGNSFAVTGVAFGIKSYSSIDLENWVYEGFLYDPFVPNPCNNIGGCGRPHIVYNPAAQKYILWANAGSSGYIIATSDSPSTGFVFANATAAIDPRFEGLQPADFAIEVFGDQGYLVFSVLNFVDPRAGSLWPPIFQTLHISPLTSDFTNTTLVSYNVTSPEFDLIDQETESPDIFERDGVFYIIASNTCSYCNGSIGLVYRSTSIEGPWTRQIIAGYSCNGQVEGVLPLTDPNSGETASIWHSTSVPGGPRVGFTRHIFQPLVFNADGSVQDLNCAADATFTVDFTKGIGAPATGRATAATDGSPAHADYYAICDSDQFSLYQTWVSSATGTLASVSINIAASVQTVNLTLIVFKFSSLSDLISPGYKWTTLGTAYYNTTSLSYVFDTAVVQTNTSVEQGDYLGLAVRGFDQNRDIDFTPYCHLEFALGPCDSEDMVLLQQGSGQNSWRGLSGRTSPVYVRRGKGLKFFATVV